MPGKTFQLSLIIVQLSISRKAKKVIEKCVVSEWNSAFFAFSFIIEGTSKEVLPFLMALQLIYNKKLLFK